MVERLTPAQMQRVRLLALVVPQEERRELERRFGPGARPALVSAILGVAEFLLGLAAYAALHPGFGSLIGWGYWHANPLTWLALMMMIVGLLRVVSYCTNQDSFGEPLVWAALRLWQVKQRADARRLMEKTFGPERPDRVVVDEDGTPVLLVSRARPGWDEYNTVRIEDEFFKIAAIEERDDGDHRAVAYLLSEVPESEVLRGVVHTDASLPAGWRGGC